MNQPRLLKDAQQLPEAANDKPHIQDHSWDIHMFLDSDNRLMRVVQDMETHVFYKMEITHGIN